MVDQGDAAAEFISAIAEREVRLVCLAPGVQRPTSKKFAVGFESGHADGFPFMTLSEASLASLNGMLKKGPLPMKRFRPNIVVAGTQPFAEDTWRVWRVGGKGGAVFQNCKPCSRCPVPTVDTDKGIFGDGEVLAVLSKKRKGRKIGVGPWGEGQFYFGQNTVCLTTPHYPDAIKVGDVVEVLEYEGKEKIVGAAMHIQPKELSGSEI